MTDDRVRALVREWAIPEREARILLANLQERDDA